LKIKLKFLINILFKISSLIIVSFLVGWITVYHGLTLPLFILSGLFLLVIVIKNPFTILMVIVFLIPLDAFITFNGASFNRFATPILLFGLLVQYIIKHKPLRLQRPVIGMIVWVVWAALSYLWAPTLHRVYENLFGYISVLVLFVATTELITSTKRIAWIIGSLLAGQLIYVIVWFITGNSDILGGFLPNVGTGDWSTHGLYIGIVISCLFAVIIYNRNYIRFAAMMALIPAGYLFFITALRRNILAIPIVILVLIVFPKKISLKSISVLMLLFISVYFAWDLIIPTLSPFLQNRFTIEDIVVSGGSGRLDIFRSAWQLWIDHPIIGGGLGSFYYYSGLDIYNATVPHNAYLEVLAETGLVGFIFWGGSFISIAWSALKTFSQIRGYPKQFYAAMSVALITFLSVVGMVQGFQNLRYFWFSLGFGIAVSTVLSNKNFPKIEISNRTTTLETGILSDE